MPLPPLILSLTIMPCGGGKRSLDRKLGREL